MNYVREDWIQNQVLSRSADYTSRIPLLVWTGTYNVNGKKPYGLAEIESLRAWLFEKNNSSSDLFILGFQEIVDLNAVNVVVTNSSGLRSTLWRESIASTLSSFAKDMKYVMVMEKHLVGILCIVFIKEKHISHLHQVSGTSAGVGVLGLMGNKGAVAIRIQLYTSTLVFVCSHLAAHRENINGRNADFHNILLKIEFPHETESEQRGSPRITSSSSSSSYGILDHDVVFWIGDLNYRICEEVTVEQCFAHLAVDDLTFLSDRDQLTKERLHGVVFEDFQEGDLNFPPTYKFQPGTSLYERRPDKKTRAPAWCDRILWKVKGTQDRTSVSLLEYTSIPTLLLSDHKPVRALFEVQVSVIIEEKRRNVFREIMLLLDKWENDNMPRVNLPKNAVKFTTLTFDTPIGQTLSVENTGNVPAPFSFIPKGNELTWCKSWCKIVPSCGTIPPHTSIQLQVTVHVNRESVMEMETSSQDILLEDTIILRIENGRDYFITVSGIYLPSCFGAPLETLVANTTVVRPTTCALLDRTISSSSNEKKTQKIPQELWRIVDDIYRNGMTDQNLWKSISDDEMTCRGIRNALDTGENFPLHTPCSMAKVFLQFLNCLSFPIIPGHLVVSNIGSDDPLRIQLQGRALLQGLSTVQYNTFLYLVSFLRELLTFSYQNGTNAVELASIISPALLHGTHRITSPSSVPCQTKVDNLRHILVHFITTNAL